MLLHLDTKNTFLPELFVRDNRDFFIFMDPQARETSRTGKVKSLARLIHEMEKTLQQKPEGMQLSLIHI